MGLNYYMYIGQKVVGSLEGKKKKNMILYLIFSCKVNMENFPITRKKKEKYYITTCK